MAEYLRELRKACRFKQDFVAAQLHITRQTYSHYETGRIRPPASRLYKLAKLYGVSVEKMMAYGETGSMDDENLKQQETGRGTEREWKNGNADCSLETLLYYFEKLDRKDKIEIISLMKIKERMNGLQEK